MSFHIVQAGGELYRVPADLASAEKLARPPQLSLNTVRRPRFAVLASRICLSHSPTHNVMIDPGDAVVKDLDRIVPMSPVPPRVPAQVAGVARPGGGLTGAYKVRCSFAVKNQYGEVVAESPLGPESTAVTLNNQGLSVTGIPISDEPGVNARRLYRTLADGAVYYIWEDIDGNTATTASLATPDEVLSQTPAATDADGRSILGNPPGSFGSDQQLDLLTAWKGRLWGRATGSPLARRDTLIWSEVRRPYAWNPLNFLPIPPVGEDEFGITGLVARRDYLGVGKRDSFHFLPSDNPRAASSRKQIASVGPVSHDSCVVFEDVAWFIAEDGVYEWGGSRDPNAIRNITRDTVHPWFNTDDYFNRAAFDKVVGAFHRGRQCVIWLVPSAGQTTLDQWIEYYPDRGVWLGPHSTDEFEVTSLGRLQDERDLERLIFTGGNGRIYAEANREQQFDGASVPPALPFVDERRVELGSADLQISPTILAATGVTLPQAIDFQLEFEFSDGAQGNTEVLPVSLLDGHVGTAGQVYHIGQALPLVSAGNIILLSRDADRQLLVTAAALTEATGETPGRSLSVKVFQINNAIVSGNVTALPPGIPLRVKTQTQVGSRPDAMKYWGHLTVLGDLAAGNRLSVRTQADNLAVRHLEIEAPVEGRTRLGRIGTGRAITIDIQEATTAKVALYGYQIPRVHDIGRRRGRRGS